MTDRLRVCMVSTSATRGGAAKVAATLAVALNLSELGVRATLYHCGDNLTAGDVVGLRRPLSRPIKAMLPRLGDRAVLNDTHPSKGPEVA